MLAMFQREDGIHPAPEVLVTRDISAGGTFLLADNPCRVGTPVKIDFMLIVPGMKESTYCCSRLVASGTVCRTTPEGMAVAFTKACRIMASKALTDFFQTYP
jgi:hypothetical protein